MTQFDFGNLSSPLPGAELADGVLEPWRDALHSSHMGDSRPSYVVPGMWWIDNATTPWVAKVFQGSDDIVMGTLDPTTLVFVPSGTDAPTAAGTSYDPSGNTVITGTNVQDALDDVEPVLAGLGTAAVEDVGTAAGNVVQLDGSAKLPAVDGSQLTNLPVTRKLVGPLTVSTGNAQDTIAHGMTGIPNLVSAYFKCLETELNYPVGEEVHVNHFTGTNSNMRFSVDDTNVYFGHVGTPQLFNKTGFTIATITPSKWALYYVLDVK